MLTQKEHSKIFQPVLILYLDIAMESSRDEALIHAYTYWAPIFYALGLTGSIASLITLQSSKFSARIYIYLKALALADLGFLVFAIRLLQLIRNKYHNGSEFFFN